MSIYEVLTDKMPVGEVTVGKMSVEQIGGSLQLNIWLFNH